MRRLVVFGSLALCSLTLGCASTETPPKPATKEGPSKPEPPPEPTAHAVIASVQMIEDCPKDDNTWRPPPVAQAVAPAAAQERARPASPPMEPAGDVDVGSAIADGGGWVQPCTQSTMQVVFSDEGEQTAHVEIETVRVLDPKSGKEVSRIRAREPAAWTGSAYEAWDQTLAPHTEVKASYVLSVPEWSEVEKTLGVGSSYGTMFVLEVEVRVGDDRQTIRSAEFPREEPHIVVT